MCLSLQPLVVGGDVSVFTAPQVVGGDVSVFTAPGGWR